MKLKEKSWIWKLTGPFASDNYTEVPTPWGDYLFYPKGRPPSPTIIKHEMIHFEQARKIGSLTYIFLYLFVLPFVWNPWRWKWEYEAYRDGSGWNDKQIRAILGSSMYGWLRK